MSAESFANINREALNKLKHLGFVEEKPKKNEKLRLKGKDSLIIVYNSNRVVVQGNEESIKKLKKLLTLNSFELEAINDTIVGTDEALKGDTFGGLVVAGVRANKRERKKLVELGVKDSKRLHFEKLTRLAKEIMANFAFTYIELLPEDYNRELKRSNVTELLNRLHLQCYIKLRTKQSKHIVDKFPGCRVGDIALEKAETRCVEVAAASIVAKYIGLKQLQRLSKLANFGLPLGSTHVKEAIREIKQRGLAPERFLKLHFSNVRKDL